MQRPLLYESRYGPILLLDGHVIIVSSGKTADRTTEWVHEGHDNNAVYIRRNRYLCSFRKLEWNPLLYTLSSMCFDL
jgi:hypothetical protein